MSMYLEVFAKYQIFACKIKKNLFMKRNKLLITLVAGTNVNNKTLNFTQEQYALRHKMI